MIRELNNLTENLCIEQIIDFILLQNTLTHWMQSVIIRSRCFSTKIQSIRLYFNVNICYKKNLENLTQNKYCSTQGEVDK